MTSYKFLSILSKNNYFRVLMINNLVNEIRTTIGISKVRELAQIALETDFYIRDLIDLTFHQKEQIGFRAAWILENIYTANPSAFSTHMVHFLDCFPKQDNASARRHYAKILALMTKKTAPTEIKTKLINYQADALVETAFAWLIDERVAVAVKSHCLNILANFVPRYPWVKAELMETMNHLSSLESVAFFAKVKQIRKQLK